MRYVVLLFGFGLICISLGIIVSLWVQYNWKVALWAFVAVFCAGLSRTVSTLYEEWYGNTGDS